MTKAARTLTLSADESERLATRIAANSIMQESGCLEWQGAKYRGGYGNMRVGTSGIGVHRVACMLQHGPAPEGRPLACHTCHNPSCVNGKHLYWGTSKDNARDREARGLVRIKKVVCRKGHAKDFPGQVCQQCHRESSMRTYHKKKAMAA